MKVSARFYSRETRKYYSASHFKASCIDEGIAMVKAYIAKKAGVSKSSLINTGYRVG